METPQCLAEDNSNDENDVDDETMSGKHPLHYETRLIDYKHLNLAEVLFFFIFF